MTEVYYKVRQVLQNVVRHAALTNFVKYCEVRQLVCKVRRNTRQYIIKNNYMYEYMCI